MEENPGEKKEQVQTKEEELMLRNTADRRGRGERMRQRLVRSRMRANCVWSKHETISGRKMTEEITESMHGVSEFCVITQKKLILMRPHGVDLSKGW